MFVLVCCHNAVATLHCDVPGLLFAVLDLYFNKVNSVISLPLISPFSSHERHEHILQYQIPKAFLIATFWRLFKTHPNTFKIYLNVLVSK